MSEARREVWITGIGLVSSLGEGLDAHVAAIAAGTAPKIDTDTFAPYVVHPMVPLDLDKQIAKKLDQRQMEAWQRIGTYAAGLALADAGLKGDAARLAETQMIVAAGGGERDVAVDCAVLAGLKGLNDPVAKGKFLNERLMSDLRPTLFLAQLSNLLAGNIAIVHGVVGASRTFMGEEVAGIDALRIAHARTAAGQGDVFLVGGAQNAERWDLLIIFAVDRGLREGAWQPVFERTGNPGFDLGSMGAFLVVEEAARAAARGARALARITHVASDRTPRRPGSVRDSLTALWRPFADKLKPGRFAVLSGATGAASVTAEEQEALAVLAPGAKVQAVADLIGHGMETQFPAAVALAVAAFRPEAPFGPDIDQVVVTGVGHWRDEGIALVERAA